MPEPVNPSGIPGAGLDPDAVEAAADGFGDVGENVSTGGGAIVTSWQRIAAHYDAPERETLFGVMDPVKTIAEGVGDDLRGVRVALRAFAEEVRPIKAELDRLRREAAAFVARVSGGVEEKVPMRGGHLTRSYEWHEHDETVQENNELIRRVNDQVERLWAAERACANAIYGLIGHARLEAASEDNPDGYGVDDIPDGAELPWGATVEEPEDCGDHVKGFVWDGVVMGGIWGTVEGLGALTFGYNPQTGEWFDGDTYAAGWSNLGYLAVGLAVSSSPIGVGLSFSPGPVGDFVRKGQEALVATGKGIIAYDKWGEDPAEAAGEAIFNVATIVIPAGAAVGGVKAGGGAAAAALRTASRLVDAVDPAAYAASGASAAVRVTAPVVSDLLKSIDVNVHVDVPHVDVPHVDVPQVDVPHVEVPHVEAPRVEVPQVGLPSSAGHFTDGPGLDPGNPGVRVQDTPGTGQDAPRGAVDVETLPSPSGSTTMPDIGTLPRGTALDPVAPVSEPVPVGAAVSDPVAPGSGADDLADGSGSPFRYDETPSPAMHPRPQVSQEVVVAADQLPGYREPFAARTDLAPDTVYRVPGRGDYYTDGTGTVSYVETSYGRPGELNYDLMHAQPGTTYVVHPDVNIAPDDASGAHVFQTDQLGRLDSAYTEALGIGQGERSQSIQSRIGRVGGDGFDGAHVFGAGFGGGPEELNLLPMLRELNRGGGASYFNLENGWRSALKETPPPRIEVLIEPRYAGESRVPTAFAIEYRIGDGIPNRKRFWNG